MIYIAPHTMSSKSAKLLAQELQCTRIRVRNSRFRSRNDKFVVNWGCSDTPFDTHLNPAWAVSEAIDKVLTYAALDMVGINVPRLFMTRQQADDYLYANPDGIILGRMNGLSGGKGIDIYRSGDTIHYHHHFYSVLEPSDTEYRVHIVRTKLIALHQKRQRKGMKEWWDDNKRIIRCHDNNWILCRTNVEFNSDVAAVARRAVEALGLDFGAVDVLWHEENGPTVLEVNTAPGIEGSLVVAYANAFRDIYNGRG
jgi:hypothetical protein